jgi:WD40 repeat protein
MNTTTRTFAAAALAGIAFTTVLRADDWPAWGGSDPGRNMYSPAKGIPAKFEPGTFKKKGQSSPTGEELHQVRYHPDGKRAVSLSDVCLRIWDTRDWSKSVTRKGVVGWLSADGAKMAVVKQESSREIEVWPFQELAKGL